MEKFEWASPASLKLRRTFIPHSSPKASYAEWRWQQPIRTDHRSNFTDGVQGLAPGRHSNLCFSKVRIGANWTWWEPIRTISEVPFEVQIPLSKPFLFQTLSEAAITLKHQGLSYLAISKILKIDDKTVKKAIERGKKLLWLLMMPFGRSP